MAKLDVADVEGLMPANHEEWVYAANSGPDHEGYEGFIAKPDEIGRLVEALSSRSNTTT